MKTLPLCICVILANAAMAAEPPDSARDKPAPAFTKKPVAAKTGDKVKVDFTVSRETDVAVFVENAKGEIVRHLVAGVLGKNAPPPLAPGLAQSLEWDGKDDLGRPAAGGPFKVRVGLGLKPALDGFIGNDPAALGGVVGLATAPNGEVYVFSLVGGLHPGDSTVLCKVFARDGRYLRTVLPWPASLPEEKLPGLKRLDLGGGVKVPFIYQVETRSLLPGAGNLDMQRAAVTPDGRQLVFTGLQETMRYNQAGVLRATAINADGSMPEGGPLRTLVREMGHAGSLAASPDGKTFYTTGVIGGGGSRAKRDNAVYKFALSDEKVALFAGTPGQAGGGEKLLSDASGVAVDSAGNVYVADKGNGRVAVYKPDGGLLGELKVAAPEQVEVHPKTGAVYVASTGGKEAKLIKFASWKAEEPAAQARLPYFIHEAETVVLALDASADPPVLWYSEARAAYRQFKLLRIEDRGDSFGEQVDISRLAGNGKRERSAGAVMTLALNRPHGLLLVNGSVYDLGKGEPVGSMEKSGGAQDAGVGLDGNFYLHWPYPPVKGRPQGCVRRLGPDLKLLPFARAEEGDKGFLAAAGSMRLRPRGLTADAAGNVYVLRQMGVAEVAGRDANSLSKYGPDGAALSERLIDSEIRSLSSVQVDFQGNVYLALGLRPGKDRLPPDLAGKVPDGPKDPDAVMGVNCYPLIYGSIAKFGPEGGKVKDGNGQGVECNYAFGRPVGVAGARWIHSGASVVPSWRTAPMSESKDICLCESPRFEVDGFGRCFFPDAARFRVGVLDTNGNEVCTFGAYGNPDSGGPKSAVPVPDIPIYWVNAVAVGDGHAYIGDRLNQRVVKVKLGYAAEENCSIP